MIQERLSNLATIREENEIDIDLTHIIIRFRDLHTASIDKLFKS